MRMAASTKQNIEATFGFSLPTMTRLEQRVHQTGSVKDRRSAGQPRVTIQRQDQQMKVNLGSGYVTL